MFVYALVPGALQTTNATPNTANDCLFVKPGAARTVGFQNCLVFGRGGGLTTISGIGFRVERWTTTASSGGSAITPAPRDPGAQAAKASAGYAAATVTSGTGGPNLQGAFGCGATGPGGWQAKDDDSAHKAEAGANQSIDLFNVSATASLNFELAAEIAE